MGPRNRKESLSPEDGDSSRPECLPRTGWWLHVSCHNTHIIHAANKETKLKDRSTQSGALIKKKKKRPRFFNPPSIPNPAQSDFAAATIHRPRAFPQLRVWVGLLRSLEDRIAGSDVMPNLSLEQLARGHSLFLSLRLLSPSASERRVTQVPPSP